MITRLFALGPLVLLPLFAGCGHRATSPIHGEVDFTKATEIFALPQTQSNPNAVVATVNGREIWSGQFQRVLNMRAAELRPRMSPEQLQEVAPRIASDVLNEIIRQYLLEEQIDAENITVAREIVDGAVEEARANIEKGGVDWQEYLDRSNLSAEDFRVHIEQELRIRQLLKVRIGEPPEAADGQIQAFYEQNRERFVKPPAVSYRNIFVWVKESDDQAAWSVAQERILELRDLAAEGLTSFEDLARQFSQDEQTKANGGLVGPIARGGVDPVMGEALFEAQAGEILGPIKVAEGFLLIRVEEHFPSSELELDAVREQIAGGLRNQAREALFAAYVEELSEASEIIIRGETGVPAAPEGD